MPEQVRLQVRVGEIEKVVREISFVHLVPIGAREPYQHFLAVVELFLPDIGWFWSWAEHTHDTIRRDSHCERILQLRFIRQFNGISDFVTAGRRHEWRRGTQ
jgi:hypothetical protein